MNFLLYLHIVLQLIVSAVSYSIPEPTVEIIHPRGFRISIPEEKGIVLVAYHVNIDKPIALTNPGAYSAEFSRPTEGRWAYANSDVPFQRGSTLSYWMHVQHGQHAYRRLGSKIASEGLVYTPDPIADYNPPRPEPSTIRSAKNCERSLTTVDGEPVCRGQLIFEDNFDILNTTMWKKEVRIPMDSDDGAFVSFQDRPENCYVNDGQLHIVPNLQSDVPGFNVSTISTGKLDLSAKCTAVADISQECQRGTSYAHILPPVISASIRTKDFFSFRYGRVEVRAILPTGDWLFPLILLEPLEKYYGIKGYASGQMRIAFTRGNEILKDRNGADISNNRIFGGAVLSTREELRSTWLKGTDITNSGKDFHNYALTWTPDFISLEVDGKEFGVIRENFSKLSKTHNIRHAGLWNNGHSTAPFDREFFLTLGVSVGGHSDFPDGCLSGQQRVRKPWRNLDPKAEFRFWDDRDNWLTTWNGEQVGLHIDYVRVYAL